jgi:alpha-ketoglutarate-dependent 2,4-dichlorophenoxyacetate dioxygenase
MPISFRKLHTRFVAEASAPDLRALHDPSILASIRAAMDEHAVLVFRNQVFTNDEQLAFAQRLDGTVNVKSASTIVLGKARLAAGLSDVSNLNERGEIWAADDRRRMSRMTNRLWHTDASFLDPPGRYSMLSARSVPPVRADTEFADMRAAYDALDADMKAKLEGLRAFHSIAYTKQILGFEVTDADRDQLKGAVHPLVRTIPSSLRRSLYIAAHVSHIVDWPIPEGRVMLGDLTEHATQPQFVYAHAWRKDDFVIWDNRATMHRGRAYDDTRYRRELVRATTLDLA